MRMWLRNFEPGWNLPIELSIFWFFVYFTIIDTYMYFVGQTQQNLTTYVLLKTYPDLT